MTPPATPETIFAAYEPAALVFDFDGTLVSSTALHEQSLRTALVAHGIDLDPGWYLANTGLPIADLINLLTRGMDAPPATTEVIASSRTWLAANLNRLEPIPATVDLARFAYARRIPCAVASSASHELVDPALRALGLAGLFGAVVAAEDVSAGKPHPEVFLGSPRVPGDRPPPPSARRQPGRQPRRGSGGVGGSPGRGEAL